LKPAQKEYPGADKFLFRALAGVNILILNSNMRVVGIDGGNAIIPSLAVDSIGIFYPGERMDIIASGGQAISLTVALDGEYGSHFPLWPLNHNTPETSNSKIKL
jgi:hypothetical protein